MANWETFDWGEEFWEGFPITATLKFYDRLGSLAKVVSTTAENSPLLKLSFTFLRDGGCGDFKLETSEDLGIERGYRLDLYLYQLLWYSARVKIVPATGTQTTFEYSGYGFFEQLDWKIVDEAYANIELSALVEDILTKYYYGKSDILPGNGEIISTGYPIEELQFTKKFGKSTMQSLAEIASNYEYGVDENRRFYFRPYDTSVVEQLWLGRGDVKSFKAEERDAKYNSYRVSCGKLTKGDSFILEVTDVPDGEFARWGTLELSEAIPPFAASLAQGATVTTFPVGVGAANITDGDTGTEWSSGIYQQIGHYIQIDLGEEKENIGKVVVDCTRIANNKTDYADGFRILVSSTGAFTGEELEVFVGEEKFGSNEVEITFPAVSGRYVRIEINDAKPFFWRVDQIYIYPWKVGDITRWVGSLLLLNRVSLKKGKLELSKIDRRILPRGKFRITSQDGSSYDDYPIVSTKYQLNGKTDLQCSFELGETTISVADEILKMQREMAEQKLMGSSRSSNLSEGLYTSPGSDQQIGVDQVEAKMIIEDAIETEHVTPGAITETEIADDSISTPKLQANVVTAEKINVLRHLVSGAVWSDNTPGAGSVQWAGASVTYNGTTYTITNGNTNLAYIWWDFSLSTTTFQTAAAKPALTDDDFIVCYNNGGTHELVWNATLIVGGVVRTASLTALELNIADLVNIANLLTVAAGRITIGANVLGAGLDGMLIVDGGAVRRVEIGEIAAATYGINIRDAAGDLITDAGEVTQRWKKIYETVITVATNSVTVPNLDGNADIEYMTRVRWVGSGPAATQINYGIRPNNDGGISYGEQNYGAFNAPPFSFNSAAERNFWCGRTQNPGEISQGLSYLSAVSGYERTCISIMTCQGTVRTVGGGVVSHGIWDDAAANITSLVFINEEVFNGIGIGSRIEVWKRVD